MLETRADTLRFQPPDKACCQFTCQIRVLTEILKIPPAERITFEIGSRPEDESDVLLPCLFADGRADLFQQRRIPAAGSRDLRRKTGRGTGVIHAQHIRRILLLSQAVGAVTHEKRGDAVSFKSLGFPEACAGAQCDLVLQRHFLQNAFYVH